MDKEVIILTQEQLERAINWNLTKQYRENDSALNANMDEWIKENPNPLPPPVKVMTEKEIEKKPFKDFHSTVDKETFCAGYNACLSDLGLK